MPHVYLRQGDDFVAMSDEPYEAEAMLQELLAEHPELLTDDGEPVAGSGWLFVRREAPLFDGDEHLSAGWLDHLFLDRDGVPTLVEVKRSSDARIRREVVGQLLDYAANAATCWSAEKLRGWFEEGCADRHEDPGELLGGVDDPEEFWSRVQTNLVAGKLRLVFVADEIPANLRRIVEFLNGQMHQTEVIAVEVKQYVAKNGEVRTFVPRVLGRTEASQRAKGRVPGRVWTQDSILQELRDRRDAASVTVAQALFAWAERRRLQLGFGAGQKDGSFQAGVNDGERYLWPFTLYTYGRVEMPFLYMARRPPFDDPARREELRGRLNAIPGVELPAAAIDQRPGIDLTALAPPEALTQFLAALEWAFEQTGLTFSD